MKLLVVAPGGRASGRSYTLAHLAAAIPHAVLIDLHGYEQSSKGHLYRRDQHITDPFNRRDGRFFIQGIAAARIRPASVVLLAGDQDVDLMIAAIQELCGPFDVIYASSMKPPPLRNVMADYPASAKALEVEL